MPRTFLAGEANWFPAGSLAELPDIEADRQAFDGLSEELPAGAPLEHPLFPVVWPASG